MAILEQYISVEGIRTHYWEAGSGDPLILLHSGEYSASAEFSWESNIDCLARHFHVYAPDFVGFGKTDKLFSFDNMAAFRVRHIQNFMKTLCIEKAMFAGSSFGGGLILNVASQERPAWNITKIITVGGGGPMSEAGLKVLSQYDCTKENLRTILEACVHRKELITEEYLERRHQMSLLPGAWESASAPRFRSPAAPGGPATLPPVDYSGILVPVLICAGDHDILKPKDYGSRLLSAIPDATLKTFENCGHFAQIEYAAEWNKTAVEFLLSE